MDEQTSVGPAQEQRRVRAHLEAAARAVEAATPAGLPRAKRSRRRALLRRLWAYIEAGRYPVNRVRDAATPVFVDGRGARCAVAALLDATGHGALVERVARTANLARVPELAGDAELAAWLDHYGLTLAEAARIQPQYYAHTEADWQPTVSVVAALHAGGDAAPGVRLTLAPGVRVGVRRVTHGADRHGNSVYGSLALTLEYARTFALGVGSVNQLGLTLHWEPDGNHRDVQWCLLGGGLAALDEDEAPGGGYGGQIGAGFSFRRRSVPLFVEAVAQGLSQGGLVLRGGVQLGAVW